MRAILCVLSGLCFVLLSACATVEGGSSANSHSASDDVIARSDLLEIPSFHEQKTSLSTNKKIRHHTLLDIDPAIKAFVEKQISSTNGLPAKNPQERFDALVEAFRSPHILNFNYVADATYTASETFRRREGNCLSLSALFLIMARHAGLDAHFQDVELLPNWRKDNEIFVLEKHINVVVTLGGKIRTVDFLVTQAGMTTSLVQISDAEAEAQYFNNLGVAELAKQNNGDAYQLFHRSIELAPRQAYLWANLGVSLSRNKQYADARQVYLQALSIEPFNTVAISNLLALQDQQPQLFADQHLHLSSQLQRRVNRLREENPYYHYWQADRAYQQGKFRQAIRDMEKGIKLKYNESRFYVLMMKAGLAIGETGFAKNNLQKARQYAVTEQDKLVYESEYFEMENRKNESKEKIPKSS